MFGEEEKESATYGKWQLTIQPELNFPLKNNNGKIIITQNDKGFGELGSRVWDGGLVLARYIESVGKIMKGRTCIELGSGTGLPSIVALLMGAIVKLTDKKSLLSLLRYNVESNIKDKEVVKNASYEELLWGEGNPFNKSFDFIIGADLTYDFEDLPLLVSSLRSLSSDKTRVIIAYGKERAATPVFIEQVSEFFCVELIDDGQLDFSDIYYPTFTIGLMSLRLKKNKG